MWLTRCCLVQPVTFPHCRQIVQLDIDTGKHLTLTQQVRVSAVQRWRTGSRCSAPITALMLATIAAMHWCQIR